MTDARAMRARSRRILRFASLYLAQTWWYELLLPRVGLAAIGNANRERRLRRMAQRFHALAVDLGGLMIKVGQFLSSRLDVLPPEITKELEGLQDEVPAVPFPAIAALAESQLGVPLAVAYEWVDPVPLAAASLGQAHRARLKMQDAEAVGYVDVVVKVQRPGIDTIVDVDLVALRRVAGWLSRIKLVSDRADAPALIEEFATVSMEEIDYLQEGANGERFAADVADDPRVRTPRVVWERSSRKVLTLEDVTAIKIADVEGLRAAGIDPHDVALEFSRMMFDQLFLRGYFHADPHPGNLFVEPTPGGARPWVITFVDFGMMGQVPEGLRRGLTRVLVAAASRDGKGLVDGIREVGVLLPSADTVQLERAMTKLFDRLRRHGLRRAAGR